VKPLLTVVAVLWVVGWLLLSGLVGVIVAGVAVPLVFIVLFIAAAAIVEAG
jgi:hypothetical protein